MCGIKCFDIETLYVGSDLSMDISSGNRVNPTCGIEASKDLSINTKKVDMDISGLDARGIFYEGTMHLDSALTIDLNKGRTVNLSTGLQGYGSAKLDIHGGPVKIRSGEGEVNHGIANTTVNLYKGSLIIDMGAADNQSYGLYNLQNDPQYGLNVKGDYLNNGGYVEITGHSGAFDSTNVSVDPALYEKGALVNKEPTKQGAVPWDKTTSMASYKYLGIPEKTYKLTVHWSSIEGVDIAGQKPVVIEDIPAGMTIEEALAKEGMSLDGEIFKKDGYIQIQAGAMYVPLEEKSWNDFFGGSDEDIVEENDTLTSDTDIYIPMWKEVKSASVTVKAPICGEKTDTQKNPKNPDEWDLVSQTNPPKYSFPAGADYGEFVLEQVIPFPKSFWGSYAEDETVPFIGEFEGGKRYDYGLAMMPKFGYIFPKNVSVTVNGSKPKSMESSGGVLILVFSDIQADHAWDSGKETKAATTTAAGVKTYTCKSCGTTKTENIPMLGKKANPLEVKGKTAKVKYSKLKKKNQTIKRSKAITVTAPQGKVTYKKVSVTYTKAKSVKLSKKALKKYKKQASKKITVNAKTGKITVKKGLKKGTYKVKVKVQAAGNENYSPSAWKMVTFKVKVK